MRTLLKNIFYVLTGRSKFLHYVKWLRHKGVQCGSNINFRDPEHTLIDLTRPSLIKLGNNLDINDNFTILTHDFSTYVFRNLYEDFVNSSGKVIIGNNIVFGRNVTILKGVSIGDNCIIGLGSVITHSIPPNSVVAGTPARVICTVEEFYKKRKSKQIEEAFEYAQSIIDSFHRQPHINDFSEEWVLFLTEEEYNNNPILKKHVDFRTKGYLNNVFSVPRPFHGFCDFMSHFQSYQNKK